MNSHRIVAFIAIVTTCVVASVPLAAGAQPVSAARAQSERPTTSAARPGDPVSPPPAVANPGGSTPNANATLQVGQSVAVEWHGQWYAGHILSLQGERVRIHYDGYDASTDETVPRRRLRIGATIPTPVPATPRAAPIQPNGTPVLVNTPLAPGLPVHVCWHGQWWAARVTVVLRDGLVGIRYDGYEPTADEIVSRDRLLVATGPSQPSNPSGTQPATPPQTGAVVDAQTPLAPGDAVHIEWSGSLYPGRVVAILPDGNVRVHYLGWGGESDENVPRTRLRTQISQPVIIPM